MCSVDETSEREMKGSEDITHARVIDSRLIYLEKISFFVRDNHNFLKVFEIHLPWWYFETLYNEIPSYHRPKLFFTSEFLFVGERKKKEKEKHWKRSKILSLFPLKNFFCHFSKDTIDASTNHRTYNLLAAISRANPTWNRVPGFHITEIFVPFQEPRLLDNAATRRRLRVSRTLSNSCSFVPRTVYTTDRKKHGFAKIKRNGGVLPDSSKFEQIFLTISNDLDKLESIALKPRDIYRRRFFKRAGFACFQEIN